MHRQEDSAPSNDSIETPAEHLRRRVAFFIRSARSAERGEKVFTEATIASLQRLLDEAQAEGIDLGSQRQEVQGLIATLPLTEIENCLRMVAKCEAAGERALATAWKQEAEKRSALFSKKAPRNQN